MPVFRVNKTKDYTMMSNFHLKDNKISLKAKGLLSQMLSLPEEWDYSIQGLVAINKENEVAIKGALNELRECNYLIVSKERNEKGQFEYVYDIYEKPGVCFPGVDNPGVDVPGVENQVQYNTNNKIYNNKYIYNKKEIYKERIKTPTLEEIEQYIKENDLNVNAKDFYDYFTDGSWHDSRGNKVKNWKLKVRTWSSYGKNNKKEAEVPKWFTKEIEQTITGLQDQEEMDKILNELESE